MFRSAIVYLGMRSFDDKFDKFSGSIDYLSYKDSRKKKHTRTLMFLSLIALFFPRFRIGVIIHAGCVRCKSRDLDTILAASFTSRTMCET